MRSPLGSSVPADRPRALPRRTVAGYAVGSLGTGVFNTVPGLVLLYYLTDTLAVPAALAGAAVFAPKVFDVFWNPLVGAWSDRTRSRIGPRRPWLLAGGLTLPVAFVLVFAVPGTLTGPAAAAWVCLAFLLAGAVFGFFQVPYIALPTELTPDPGERTRLQTARIAVLTVGILLGGAATPVLVDAAGGARTGYRVMATVIGAVLALALLTCAALLPTTDAPATGLAGGGLVGAVRDARRSRSYWLLFTGYLGQALAVAVALAAIPYYCRYLLGRPGFSSVLFAAFVGPALLVVPLWRRAATRWGKHGCLIRASVGFAAGALLAAPAAGSPVLPVLAFLICGVGYAGMQVFAYSLLADALGRPDTARSGALAGLWTAGETGMAAVGPGLLGLLLAAAGFVAGSDAHPAGQPGTALVAIGVGLGVVPAALVAVSVLRFRAGVPPPDPRSDPDHPLLPAAEEPR